MNAYVLTERAEYTITDADRLKVSGELVEIQRHRQDTPQEFETIAVVGRGDLGLVSLGQDPEEHELVGGGEVHGEPVERLAKRDDEPCTYEPW